MKYIEELHWILDKLGSVTYDEEKIRENIDFVHSLGLKCDNVGWCKLNPVDSAEILEKISAFCKNGWEARCIYKRCYINVESDWYELVPTYFKDNTAVEDIETPTENTEKVYTCVIRAFHELNSGPKRRGEALFVPERFRKICIQNGYELDFCWAKDIGKFESEQYFHIYGKKLIPRIAVDFGLNESSERLHSSGGWLPLIADVFHKIQMVNMPDCYLREDLPEQGIAYVHIPMTFSCAGRHKILIHKNIAKILLQQRVLSASALSPAPVVDTLPGGYVLQETQPIARPAAVFLDKMLSEYETLKNMKRPLRIATEKEAIKNLRSAKKSRKTEFQKAMPKPTAEAIASDYAPIAPYYLVANGGFLSEEYEFLSYEQAGKEHNKLCCQLEKDELLAQKPDGALIAKCANGDWILLLKSGGVVRFSHEAPEITAQWPSLSQFFIDALND